MKPGFVLQKKARAYTKFSAKIQIADWVHFFLYLVIDITLW